MADCHYSNLGARKVRSPLSSPSAIALLFPSKNTPSTSQILQH
ncbi:hypothetical protein [Microcoleus anatoxicus]